jgi:hypothetical protein
VTPRGLLRDVAQPERSIENTALTPCYIKTTHFSTTNHSNTRQRAERSRSEVLPLFPEFSKRKQIGPDKKSNSLVKSKIKLDFLIKSNKVIIVIIRWQ